MNACAPPREREPIGCQGHWRRRPHEQAAKQDERGAASREACRQIHACGAEQIEVWFERQNSEYPSRIDRVRDERRGQKFDGHPTDRQHTHEKEVVQQHEREPDEDPGALRLCGRTTRHRDRYANRKQRRAGERRNCGKQQVVRERAGAAVPANQHAGRQKAGNRSGCQ